jgi:hypothetical protein
MVPVMERNQNINSKLNFMQEIHFLIKYGKLFLVNIRSLRMEFFIIRDREPHRVVGMCGIAFYLLRHLR